MNFKIEKKEMLNALQVGGALSGKKVLLPILENVHIHIRKDNYLVVTSFDGEATITKKVLCLEKDFEDFTFCVDGNYLLKLIRTIDDDILSFELSDNELKINHLTGIVTLAILDTSDYPTQDIAKFETSFYLLTQDLLQWLDISRRFIANDDLRPIMNTMYLGLSKKDDDWCVDVCATNAHKLYTQSGDVFNVSSVNDCEKIDSNVSSRIFLPLLSFLNDEEKVKVSLSRDSIMFSQSTSRIVCRLIDGRYPNFKSIIPNSSPIQLTINKKLFKDSLNRAILCSDIVANLVKLDISSEKLEIRGDDTSRGRKGVETIDVVSYNGNALSIGVKGENMIDALDTIATKNVVLEMSDNTRAIIIHEDFDECVSNKVILVMPVLV